MRRAYQQATNRGNLRITIGAALLLAFLIGTLLRQFDSALTTLARFHIPMPFPRSLVDVPP